MTIEEYVKQVIQYESNYETQTPELARAYLILLEQSKKMQAALELIADKMPSCDCMDAPGIARQALEKDIKCI